MSESERHVLLWILENSFECTVKQEDSCMRNAFAESQDKCTLLIEVGPRLNFSTAFSTNAVAICRASALQDRVHRIERSVVFLLRFQVSAASRSTFTSFLILCHFLNMKRNLSHPNQQITRTHTHMDRVK